VSGHCDFCGIWHSASCCHPGRAKLLAAQAEIASLNDEVEEQAAGRRHIQGELSAEIETLTKQDQLPYKQMLAAERVKLTVSQRRVEKLRATLKGLPRWAYVEDEHWDSIQQALAETEEGKG